MKGLFMRNSAKLGLTALIAALLLASAVSTATAGRISTDTQNIRTTWSRIEFRAAVIVRCQVTLEGSFHSRTIVKIEGSLIGAVTRVSINACTGGSASPLRLPWHLTYQSFRGTLPRITGVRLLFSRFQFGLIVEITRVLRTCLYGTASDNLTYELGVNPSDLVTTLQPIEGRNVTHLLEGPIGGVTGCPLEGRLIAAPEDGITRELGTNEEIKIRLI